MKTYLPKMMLLMVLLCTFSACEKKHEDETFVYYRIRINHYQQAINTRLVYVIQEGTAIGSDTWQDKDLHIDDFAYEPGYVYDIDVMNLHKADAPSNSGLKLKKMVSKTKVPDNAGFEVNLRLNGANLFSGQQSTGYMILNKLKFDCGSICTELTDAISANQTNIIGQFVRNTNGTYLLKGLKYR